VNENPRDRILGAAEERDLQIDPAATPDSTAMSEACSSRPSTTEMPRGGHFAAMDAPDLLVEDIRALFSALLSGRIAP